MALKLLLLLVISLISMLMDIKNGKINNKWLFSGWLLGLLCQIGSLGPFGGVTYMAATFMPILMLFPLFGLGMFGGGDLKLLAVLCGILGVRKGARCILYSLIFGGALSLCIVFRKRILKERICYLISYIKSWKSGKPVHSYIQKQGGSGVVHFTIPIFMSVLYCVGGFY